VNVSLTSLSGVSLLLIERRGFFRAGSKTLLISGFLFFF